jgi:poly-gamma-glutamate synthesis protein (capsule biosynthesis protein)
VSRIAVFGQALITRPVDWPEPLRALTAGTGAAFCNLEASIAPPEAWPFKDKTVHATTPAALGSLAALGITHVSLANNHAWDFGPAGVLATRAAAEAAGLAVAGAGRTLADAWAPAVRGGLAVVAVDCGPTPDFAVARPDRPGVAALPLRRRLVLPQDDLARLAAIEAATGEGVRRARRIAVGYDAAPRGPRFYGVDLEPGVAPAEAFAPDPAAMERLADSIAAARAEADTVLVSLHHHHWAPDWAETPGWFAPLAAAIRALGADAVAGHGPPLVHLPDRPGEPVAPSLGNLCFHTRRPERYRMAGMDVFAGLCLTLTGAAPEWQHFTAPGS